MPFPPSAEHQASANLTLEQLKAEQAALEKQVQTSTQPQQKPVWWSVQDAMTISTVVLGFGLLVVAVGAYLIRKERDGNLVLKVLGTILILTFSVFLIVAGYDDRQIAPALGLLGTVAGYLLGREGGTKSQAEAEPRGG